MDLIVLILFISIFAWIFNRWKCRASVKLAYKVPSNKWQTLLGWGKLVSEKEILSTMYEHGNKYGANSVFWMGPYPFFITSEPQTVKDILTSKNCIGKPLLLYDCLVSVAGHGILTESDPYWNIHRKVLSKAFTTKNVTAFIPIFNKEINTLIEEMDQSLERREKIDLLLLFRQLALQNTTKTTLKRDLTKAGFNPTNMSERFNSILQYTAKLAINPWLSIKFIRYLANIFSYRKAIESIAVYRKLIVESVKLVQNNNISNASIISNINSLLENIIISMKQYDPDGNIIKLDDEVKHIFIASFETSSTTLFLVITLLAMHPDYQQRVYEEITNIIPDNDETDITLEQLNRLDYLEMIFNESLRVFPTIPLVFRKVSHENLTLTNGIVLPLQQIIGIDIYRLHRDKNVWGPNADRFNPDNFLPSNVNKRHHFSYIPFTKGQRYCIGSKYAQIVSKLSLVKLLKNFKFLTDFKYEDLKFENHVSLHFTEDPQIRIERRKNKI